MTSIAINNMGLCTPLGNDHKSVTQNLIAANTDGMQWRNDLLFNASTLVGQVSTALPTLPKHLSQFDCRNNRILLSSALQIEAAVTKAKTQFGSDRIGVIIGTSTSGISKGESALKYRKQHGHFPNSYHYFQQELGSSSDFLRQLFELSGPCYTVSTACSSSTKVFASAKRMLLANLCDMVIVGGVDSLCQLTLNGFASLESVSKGHCKPFSKNRDGINIGEGSALFTLELGQGQVNLSGIGESSDAHHISAPHPDGEGAITAMQAALRDASLRPEDISYINLHGTATPKNDAMESRAINSVFGDNIPLCSSTKPITGHALGAAGAIEAALAFLLLQPEQKQLPPHKWDGEPDLQDPQLPLVINKQEANIEHVMSNSFAFGGSNACLILSRGI